MIHFVTLPEVQYTLTTLERLTRTPASKTLTVQHYSVSPADFVRTHDIVILCDLERYGKDELVQLQRYADNCLSLGARVLNHPAKAGGRFTTLERLWDAGINPFRVYRYPYSVGKIKLPAFIRDEYSHNGPASALLYSESDILDAAEQFFKDQHHWPLVVEYAETRDSEADQYVKYGAFYLAGAVVPRHRFVNTDWVVKMSNNWTRNDLELEARYIEENTAEAHIRSAFMHAKIEYGRIDFATKSDGGIVVFEINTNPMVLDRGEITDGPRAVTTSQPFFTLFQAALNHLAMSNS